MTPSISFVIPAYNEEALIGACIDSINAEIDRSGIKAEVIVVDNASTDATGLIALKYFATVVFESNKGITRARQAGYKYATNEWVANIDADSVIPEEWFERVRNELDDPGVVAVSGPLRFKGLPAITQLGISAFYFLARSLHRNFGAMLQGGNCLIRKSALDEIGGYDTSIEFYGEDTRTAALLSKIGEVRYVTGMWIWSSARRLQKEGIVTTAWRYTTNYFWVTLRGRAFTETYKDIRS
jgi:glycosyltransferase involved in cell wall biosynthesis